MPKTVFIRPADLQKGRTQTEEHWQSVITHTHLIPRACRQSASHTLHHSACASVGNREYTLTRRYHAPTTFGKRLCLCFPHVNTAGLLADHHNPPCSAACAKHCRAAIAQAHRPLACLQASPQPDRLLTPCIAACVTGPRQQSTHSAHSLAAEPSRAHLPPDA